MKAAKIHPLADEELFQASEYYKNKRERDTGKSSGSKSTAL
jgi:hypothetical protein